MSDTLETGTVIIGCGVSGITTANTLLDNDYNDFLILESLNRIGGRVNTIDYGKFKLFNSSNFKIIKTKLNFFSKALSKNKSLAKFRQSKLPFSSS